VDEDHKSIVKEFIKSVRKWIWENNLYKFKVIWEEELDSGFDEDNDVEALKSETIKKRFDGLEWREWDKIKAKAYADRKMFQRFISSKKREDILSDHSKALQIVSDFVVKKLNDLNDSTNLSNDRKKDIIKK